jgi:hypothetical protein
MRRLKRGLRAAVPALAVPAAGCAHYGDTSTSAYIWGSLFILLGIGIAIAITTGNR